MMRKQMCCSCSGKVLIAGGYLVLEKPNIGLVVATSSRFYSLVKSLPQASTESQKTITVKSPQFVQAEWSYVVETGAEGPMVLEQRDQATIG